MADISRVVALQNEKIRPKLQELIEMTTGVGQFIKRASEDHIVSRWSQTLQSTQTLNALRLPLLLSEGGNYAKADLDDADLPTGTNLNTAFLSLGSFDTAYAVKMSFLAMKSTDKSEKAIVNAWTYQTKKSIKGYQTYWDTDMHQDGTGVLATGNGTGSPSNTNPTYNLEASFGPQRLRKGQTVEVFSADLTTSKGQLTVASLDIKNKTVTLTGTVTGAGAINTDAIAYPGMSATLAVGSWRAGIYTYINTAASGYTLGLNRATVTDLISPYYDAGGAKLTSVFGLIVKDIQTSYRDPDALQGRVGFTHMAQRRAWYELGISLSEWKRGSSDKMIDVMPDGTDQEDGFVYCGIPFRVSKKWDRSRMDTFVPKNWVRAVMLEADFFSDPSGSQKYFVSRNSSGGAKTAFNYWLVGSDNVANVDPQTTSVISSLEIPSGH